MSNVPSLSLQLAVLAHLTAVHADLLAKYGDSCLQEVNPAYAAIPLRDYIELEYIKAYIWHTTRPSNTESGDLVSTIPFDHAASASRYLLDLYTVSTIAPHNIEAWAQDKSWTYWYNWSESKRAAAMGPDWEEQMHQERMAALPSIVRKAIESRLGGK